MVGSAAALFYEICRLALRGLAFPDWATHHFCSFRQKHHLRMMIILTLRQQSGLRRVAFLKPHMLTHTMCSYSVISFCVFLCDPKLCLIGRDFLDPSLVLRWLPVQKRKMSSFYIVSATCGVKLGFFKGAKRKKAEYNTKKQGFIVEKPSKHGAFYRSVGKMAKIC